MDELLQIDNFLYETNFCKINATHFEFFADTGLKIFIYGLFVNFIAIW